VTATPERDVLRGRVAVVAGATRAAGRGIAVALGEAGADIWGGELIKGGPADWNTPIWEHDLEGGLRLLRLAIDTPLITSHHLLPLLIDRPGRLLVDVTDGTTSYNWREALKPGRADGAPTAPEAFAASESPRYVGRAVVELASDPDRARGNQRSVSSAELSSGYGFTDVDGSRPDVRGVP
jgi:hypothetical protein